MFVARVLTFKKTQTRQRRNFKSSMFAWLDLESFHIICTNTELTRTPYAWMWSALQEIANRTGEVKRAYEKQSPCSTSCRRLCNRRLRMANVALLPWTEGPTLLRCSCFVPQAISRETS